MESLAPQLESSPASTNVGAWQSERFDLSKCLRVGCWELVGGNEAAGNLNRRVKGINGDNPVPMNAAWHNPGERWRRVWKNWREKFDGDNGDVAPVVDWLKPGIFGSVPMKTTEKRPIYCAWTPHGKLDDSRAANLDYFSALSACADGRRDLVDGFYEGCRRYRKFGVQIIKHDGAPDHDDRAKLWGRDALNKQHALNEFSGAAIGLDASVAVERTRKPTCATERLGSEYWSNGQGCFLEGVPDPTDPAQAAWMTLPWPVICTWKNAEPRIGPAQAAYAKGRWPVINTPAFDAAYGSRWFVWCVELEQFGPGYDAGWRTEADGKAYLAKAATKVKEILTLHPRTIALLPKGVPDMAVKWGIPASVFLP